MEPNGAHILHPPHLTAYGGLEFSLQDVDGRQIGMGRRIGVGRQIGVGRIQNQDTFFPE
jgi:hypothetical protein